MPAMVASKLARKLPNTPVELNATLSNRINASQNQAEGRMRKARFIQKNRLAFSHSVCD